MNSAPTIAVIGGSGLYHLAEEGAEAVPVETPYAPEPVLLYRENADGVPLWFLPRHGKGHAVPPHCIDYRAQMHALKLAGARRVIAVNAVGGIDPAMEPGRLVVPDQIIDYTWGRAHTYFDGLGGLHDHADFTHPYCPRLRRELIAACHALGLAASGAGVYGCTQGPRLETAAEILRLRRDGCHLVGMTAMPEAALARELKLAYASLCLVVNRAAGLDLEPISMEDIRRVLAAGMENVRRVIRAVLATNYSAAKPPGSGST